MGSNVLASFDVSASPHRRSCRAHRCLSLIIRALVVLFLANPVSSRPAMINFDDLDASVGDVDLAAQPYYGVTWAGVFAYTSMPGFEGFNQGIVSANNAAYSGGEVLGDRAAPLIGRITGATFDFTSAQIGAGYYDQLDVTVQGLRTGEIAFSKTVTLDTRGARLIQFNYSNIDELQFFAITSPNTTDPFACGTFNCTQFTLDDLTFFSPVPELSTLTLLIAAMIVAGVWKIYASGRPSSQSQRC